MDEQGNPYVRYDEPERERRSRSPRSQRKSGAGRLAKYTPHVLVAALAMVCILCASFGNPGATEELLFIGGTAVGGLVGIINRGSEGGDDGSSG